MVVKLAEQVGCSVRCFGLIKQSTVDSINLHSSINPVLNTIMCVTKVTLRPDRTTIHGNKAVVKN